jgi:hypothetical protein
MEPEAESVRQPRLPFLRGKKAVRQVDTYRLSRGREAPAECGCGLLLGACTTVCQWWLFPMEPEMFFFPIKGLTQISLLRSNEITTF